MFLYTNTEPSEREINSFHLPENTHTQNKQTKKQKQKKPLGINLTKEVKDLYTKNYKTLMKEVEKAQINGKMSCVHGLENLILLKCPYNPKQSTNSIQSL